MDSNDVKEKLLEMLADICEDDIVMEELNINLDEEELIDSVGYTELLLRIEDELGLVISPSEYTRDEFNTPAKIIKAVKIKMGF